ncbi:anaerobic ribonucleoside-triphosphate reductase activating protein [Pyrodictium delaneyi]|uniref:Anaerobic ribonucleoside-triphosphate reductase activating protein n=1 Tax=Pyrodictium delaneyi TaxID=1273541 RepID=A0A211YRN4_9CREN|nr:anaerobic ribonucleoside-triphosphate reductase activating protein [Pyrodictium delaneyi]
MGLQLLIGGWKAPSLVDVRGRATFTLWLCGCNLRCPFCHNWRLAETSPEVCRRVELDRVVEALSEAARLVDMLHVTGGEPLLQPRGLEKLLEASRELGLGNSVNTNCTLPGILKPMLDRGLVGHVATDLKTPFQQLTGLQEDAAKRLYNGFLECLSMLADYGVEVELRIPVPREIPGYVELLGESLRKAAEALQGTKWYVVVNPLRGQPLVTPRDNDWCTKYCNPEQRLVGEVVEVARKFAGKVYVNRTLLSA